MSLAHSLTSKTRDKAVWFNSSLDLHSVKTEAQYSKIKFDLLSLCLSATWTCKCYNKVFS